MNHKTFYIATSLANWRHHNELRDVLLKEGHRITHDWTSASPWVKERSGGVAGEEAKENFEAIRNAGALDLKGVRDADVTIVLLTDDPQKGTHAELGAALVLGKPVVLVGTEEQFWNASGYTCAFYHQDQVTKVEIYADDILWSWQRAIHSMGATLHGFPIEPPEAHALGLDAMARAAYDNASNKGFWDKKLEVGSPDIGTAMMGAVSELCEAFEAWRDGRDPLPEVDNLDLAFEEISDPDRADVAMRLILMVTELAEAFIEHENHEDLTTILVDVDRKPGKTGGFPTELADVIIRIGDLAGHHGIPLDEAVARKMAYNTGRPYMHGKRC